MNPTRPPYPFGTRCAIRLHGMYKPRTLYLAIISFGIIIVALTCWCYRVVRPCGALAECSTFGRVPHLAEPRDEAERPWRDIRCDELAAGRTVYPAEPGSPMLPRVGTNGVAGR